MTDVPRPPRSEGELAKRVLVYARRQHLAEGRVRRWISHMVLCGALIERAQGASQPDFLIKGGVALELRLRRRARATRDLDVTLARCDGPLIDAVESALQGEFEGFTFRRKGEPYVMPNRVLRVEIAIQYKGRSWATVRLDVTTNELDTLEIEYIKAFLLRPFGLTGPERLPCLALPYQIAQKIHAVSESRPQGRDNDRVRDMVDLLLLRGGGGGGGAIADLAAVRAACQRVFDLRGTHSWPPTFEPPDWWVAEFEQSASEVGLREIGFAQALSAMRTFIGEISCG